MITNEMIAYCRDLGNGATPQDTNAGLCSNFRRKFNGIEFTEFVDYSDYPEYSGDPIFPVPSTNIKICAIDIYLKRKNLWIFKYGKERRKFCLWVADELERLMEAQ